MRERANALLLSHASVRVGAGGWGQGIVVISYLRVAVGSCALAAALLIGDGGEASAVADTGASNATSHADRDTGAGRHNGADRHNNASDQHNTTARACLTIVSGVMPEA